jgi:hypothetical protein
LPAVGPSAPRPIRPGTVKRAALALGALGRGSRRGAGAVAGPRVVPKDPEVRQTLAQIAYAVRRKIFEGSS